PTRTGSKSGPPPGPEQQAGVRVGARRGRPLSHDVNGWEVSPMKRMLGRSRHAGGLRGGVAALVLLVFALCSLAFASGAQAETIETVPEWNGSEFVQPFGSPETETYGQTVTAPTSGTTLDSFTFYMEEPTGLLFRGFVYAWDEATHRAIGPKLYESGDRHTNGSGF